MYKKERIYLKTTIYTHQRTYGPSLLNSSFDTKIIFVFKSTERVNIINTQIKDISIQESIEYKCIYVSNCLYELTINTSGEGWNYLEPDCLAGPKAINPNHCNQPTFDCTTFEWKFTCFYLAKTFPIRYLFLDIALDIAAAGTISLSLVMTWWWANIRTYHPPDNWRMRYVNMIRGNALAPNMCNSIPCTVRTFRQRSCNQTVGSLLCSMVRIFDGDGS